MLKSKLKASALVIAVLFPLVLSGCSSESSKVTTACGLVEQGATGLKAGDEVVAANSRCVDWFAHT